MSVVLEDITWHDLKNDNREAFNCLFRHYYPRVKAYVSSMMEDDIAEDITQDVFLYVWENRKKLYVGKGFHSYLFQSAYTRSLDYLKKHQLTTSCNLQSYDVYVEQCGVLLKDDCLVMKGLYTKDFYQRLFELLEQMPLQRREVFMLTFMQEMKSKDVADILGMPQRTVESHIYLSVKYLKEHMSKKDFFPLFLLLLKFY